MSKSEDEREELGCVLILGVGALAIGLEKLYGDGVAFAVVGAILVVVVLVAVLK